MKRINQFITEYIIKKKLDKPIDSEYKYHPQTKEELIENIKECFSNDDYDLNYIDTRAITDMSNLFNINFYNPIINNKTNNINISKWNVSNVINMKLMFNGFENFNCDLSGWDVSNVEDMNSMFSFCKNFVTGGFQKRGGAPIGAASPWFYTAADYSAVMYLSTMACRVPSACSSSSSCTPADPAPMMATGILGPPRRNRTRLR